MKVLGTAEAAKRLGITTTRFATMIRAGIITAHKVGRSWVIVESEIIRVEKLPRPPGRPRKRR